MSGQDLESIGLSDQDIARKIARYDRDGKLPPRRRRALLLGDHRRLIILNGLFTNCRYLYPSAGESAPKDGEA